MNEEAEEAQLPEWVPEDEEQQQEDRLCENLFRKEEDSEPLEEETEGVMQEEKKEQHNEEQEKLEEVQNGEELQQEDDEQVQGEEMPLTEEQQLDKEQEEVGKMEDVEEKEEEEEQQEVKEEVQCEEMSRTEEQQSKEQQLQTEEVQQPEETQDFDTQEQNHNNQVLIRLRGMQKYKSTSQRLKVVLEQMDRGVMDLQELRRNLELAAAMLDSIYTDETRRLLDTEDELSDLQSESVPSEVRDWLACTFSRKMGVAKRRPEEKPRFRSIVHAVQAGIFVERMYRRTSNMAGLNYPPTALAALKEVDQWSFDVFAFHEATGEHALKFLVYDLLTRYDLVNRFRIPVQALVQFVEALESGYSKHRNPYHNLIHAADVTQTAHFLMLHTGLMHWLSELEILAMVFAAAIHDFEHTGTTNNFHIHTRSEAPS
uniref:Phosphodiesterase n=1 Tax=Nothobranchius korthausae TaxID=1143690 RepID=A0A1A8FLI8_9TELE